jgi:hypothetical protein
MDVEQEWIDEREAAEVEREVEETRQKEDSEEEITRVEREVGEED